MRKRLLVALLVYLPTNAVLFGVGAVTILLVPDLNARAATLFPVVVAASFIVAAPIAWIIAPRLQARSFRQRGRSAQERADADALRDGRR